jgi:hypothetical protein
MIINQQISRQILQRVANPRIGFQGGDKKHAVNVCSRKTVQTCKVIVLCESHLKGSVLRIGNYLSATFEVNGFINSGDGSEKNFGKYNNGLIQTDKKNDVLVLSGGVNDVYNNSKKKVILQLVKFLEDNDNANIIMIRYSAEI